MTPWTPLRIEVLRRMWHENYTTQQIADELGTTKNAIIGKLGRLGLRAGTLPASAVVKDPHRIVRKQQRREHRKSVATTPVVVDLGPPPPDGGYTLMDLPPKRCKWPVGDKFCGQPMAQGSYCGQHARMSRHG